jgi:hypothetical protein
MRHGRMFDQHGCTEFGAVAIALCWGAFFCSKECRCKDSFLPVASSFFKSVVI